MQKDKPTTNPNIKRFSIKYTRTEKRRKEGKLAQSPLVTWEKGGGISKLAMGGGENRILFNGKRWGDVWF